MRDTHIWYFENSGLGIVVKNLEYFIVQENTVRFRMKSKRIVTMDDKEDVENFKKNILNLE